MSRTSKSLHRLVIKIGSNVLSGETGLRKNFFGELARQVRHLQNNKIETVIVTSGAVATAMAHFGKKWKPESIPEKQAYAAFGQPMLMHQYALSFARQDLAIAQILLTQADLENRKRFLNAKQAINTLLGKKIIPIINENDTVAVDELKFGDNDQLSAHVANLVNADLLLILSDVAGLYDKDPSRFKDAKIIPVVETIDVRIEAMIFKTHEGKSTGGMATKIKAAKLCTHYGLPLRITSGFQKDIAVKLLNQTLKGTLFTVKNNKSIHKNDLVVL